MPKQLTKAVTTKDILEAVRDWNTSENRPASDYYVAKMLGIKSQSMTKYLHGNMVMGNIVAIRACELLDWPQEFVLSCLEMERCLRANDAKSAAVWSRLVKSQLTALSVYISIFSFMHF